MPEENEVYLAVPYLNEDGLELYTKLILKKLSSLVITSNTNIHDYEQEYSANPAVEVRTLEAGIEADSTYVLPLSYGVGSGQLRITVSGYIMYPGIDYEEIGNDGDISNQVKFLSNIEAGSILGIIVYPKQFSFGRNINVSNVVVPNLAISENPSSILNLDEDGKLILTQSTIEEIAERKMEGVLHSEGEETVGGQKIFKTSLKVDLSDTDMYANQILPVMDLSFQANGINYAMHPLNVIAGHESNEAYNGALMIGSTTGCTWIGSGDSFLSLPNAFDGAGIDFSADESVIVSSDTKISFYVGCANDGLSFIKAAEFASNGATTLYGPAFAPTPPLDDSSTRIATTEFVRQTTLDAVGDQSIDGIKTFLSSPVAPTPSDESNDGTAATTEFVKNVSVLLTNEQEIDGKKTFNINPVISGASPRLEVISEMVVKETLPSRRIESGIDIYDRTGAVLGRLIQRYDSNGESSMILEVEGSSETSTSSIGIAIDANGNSRTFAPTPPAGNSSSRIATTKFVDDSLNSFRDAVISKMRDVLSAYERNGNAESIDYYFNWKETNSVEEDDASNEGNG